MNIPNIMMIYSTLLLVILIRLSDKKSFIHCKEDDNLLVSVNQNHTLYKPSFVSPFSNNNNSIVSNNKTSDTNMKSQLININNHESSEQSVISSFYNLFNNQNNKDINSDEIKVSKLLKGNSNQASQPTNQAIPLGSNEIASNEFPMQSSEINVDSLMMTNDIEPSQALMVEPSIFRQSLALQPSNEQVLANLYIDGMGNQQLVPMPISMTNGGQPQMSPNNKASSFLMQSAGAQGQNFYSMNSPSSGAHYPNINQQQELNPKLENYHKQKKPINKRKKIKLNDTKKKDGKLLTNEQLASLIDELKEFNVHQASKIHVTSPIAPISKSIDNSLEKDNEDELNSSDSLNDINSEFEKHRAQTKVQETPPKMINDKDLAKFAKFLMSKEGANMRFQLGLEKDSPDDGDEEDDRDSLLETSKNTMRTKVPEKNLAARQLDDLDKKHSQVASQMDKFIEELADRTNDVAKLKRRQRRKKNNKRFDRKNIDEYLKARGRRDGGSKKIKDGVELHDDESNTTTHENQPNVAKHDAGSKNFARMLIKQELMLDESDSESDDTKNQNTPRKDTKLKRQRQSRDANYEPSEIVSQTEGNDYNEYPKDERKHDHVTLINEMQEARGRKAKLRSRLPISASRVTDKALNGEFGVRAETKDGNLIIKSNRNSIVQLKVPQNESVSNVNIKHRQSLPTRTFYDDDNDGGDDASSHNNNDNNNNKNQATSKKETQAQINDNVKIQSDKSLKDEYPISEKVSDRLNKLSSSLDRYFNDGFIQEVETKSKPNKNNKSRDESKNVDVEANDTDKSATKINEKNLKVDHDFDVDTGIDGKVDTEKLDDAAEDDANNDKDDEEEGDLDENIATKANESIRRKRLMPTKKKHDKSKRNVARQKSGNGTRASINRKGNNNNNFINERPGKLDESKSGSVRMSMSAGNDNVEYEQRGGLVPNLDPVDSEQLETPIGQDDGNESPNLETAAKVKSSRGSDRLSSKYGRQTPVKFYDEPEW